MKSEGLPSSKSYQRIEFSIATVLFLLYVLFKLLEPQIFVMSVPDSFTRFNISYNYFRNDLMPSLIQALAYYLAFIIVSASIKLQLKDGSLLWKSIGVVVLVYVLLSVIIATTNTYLHAYIFNYFQSNTAAINSIFSTAFLTTSFILPVFIFYHLVSRNFPVIFNLDNKRSASSLLRSIVVAVIIWLTVFMVLLVSFRYTKVAVSWLVAMPYCMVIFYLNIYWLFPLYMATKSKAAYLLRMMPVGVLLCIGAVLLYTSGIGYGAYGWLIVASVVFIVLQIVSILIAWISFRSSKQHSEITSLTTALGTSAANLDFLRSQINPHFLFNVLNTIYGTALQEQAERTGEAVLKLSEMMRFMLYENMQEKILLQREIEYLNNYISLQQLRTANSSGIGINTDIEDYTGNLYIAPMLLIPFIENAFKHGISMQEPSYIKTSLYVKEQVVYYDVYNSIHHSASHDPEAKIHGIGLNNVKQRLELLYPKKHELIIRQTTKEYFIHLTLHL